MKDVSRMMNVHLKKIMNYFTHRIANARPEGINSKISLIEKMTYRDRNKEHLKTAIYYFTRNLHESPMTPILKCSRLS